jgi:hypothetical protein
MIFLISQREGTHSKYLWRRKRCALTIGQAEFVFDFAFMRRQLKRGPEP